MAVSRIPFLAVAAAMAMASSAAPARELAVERAVLLQRHGVRAPLAEEAGGARLATRSFPIWSTPPSVLTPHGAEAARLLAGFDRARFVTAGLLPARGCPKPGTIRIWANITQRTIATGHAVAEGLAPGCSLAVDHLPEGRKDPLFDATESDKVQFDANDAAASINRELDDGRALSVGQGPALATMATILGCDRAPKPCDLSAMPNRIAASKEGNWLTFEGPIALSSGTAQVFLLQYAEGLPLDQVGWGRADAARIEQVSRLHALLFDVYARSRYMAPRVGGLLARRIVADLEGSTAARISLLVGHDNNIAAVTALMGVHFRLPGYGQDDPPIGGGLLFEKVRDRATGKRFVRLFYQAQTPDQVRNLTPLDGATPPSWLPLAMPFCGGRTLCPAARFAAGLRRASIPARRS